MIFASGFVEANAVEDVNLVIQGFQTRNVELSGVNAEKVIFLIERETATEVKNELEALNSVAGVRSVQLTYFSLEGSDEDMENMPSPNS
jgi:nitrate reductase NapAB chaperone NapD